MYTIRATVNVETDVKRLPTHHRCRILAAIETLLVERPTTPSRNRKLVVNLARLGTTEVPIWELRVADFRVFYDVAVKERTVYVRVVRRKPAGKMVEDVSAHEFQERVKQCVDDVQDDRLVIMSHGKPAAVPIGVEGGKTIVLQTDPRFWMLIRARRKGPTIPVDQLKTRVESNAR